MAARLSEIIANISRLASRLRTVQRCDNLRQHITPKILPAIFFNRAFKTSALATKTVNITFIDRDGDKTTVQAKEGDTLLDVAKDNDIDLEGACEGTLACSTCHLIFDPEQYEKLGLDPPIEEELDMLDLAYGLTETSRLGCQIEVTKEMDGLVLQIPCGSYDARG